MFNYLTLSILAQVGKLVCMAALEVSPNHLTQEFTILQNMSIDIDLEREIIIPLAKKRALISKQITALSQNDFVNVYGSAMSLDDFKEYPIYEEEDLLEKALDRLIERGGALYWLDNDTLKQWVGACFRYAALKTKIMHTQNAEDFLTSLGNNWQSLQ